MNGGRYISRDNYVAKEIKARHYVCALIVFWILAFAGGLIVMLIFSLTPFTVGEDGGGVVYIVLSLVCNGIGAYAAGEAADLVLYERRPMFCMVNCIVAAAFFFFTETLYAMVTGDMALSKLIRFYVAVAVYIYMAIKFYKRVVESKGGTK